MSLTSTRFPMYDLPELADAYELFGRRLDALVRRGGFLGDVPLTQVCGYPLVTSLRQRFDVIAAPVYDVPFSRGATHCGLVVVGANAPYAALRDLQGTRFALNAWDSNTGMNLPRRLFAPLSERGRFFGGVIETGSHAASLVAVQSGAADVASIDNITFALLAEHRPAAVAGVRVLRPTVSAPTLPFVAPVDSNRSLKALLYDALAATIDDMRGSGSGTALRLAGVERASVARYEPLLLMEKEATALGYGVLG